MVNIEKVQGLQYQLSVLRIRFSVNLKRAQIVMNKVVMEPIAARLVRKWYRTYGGLEQEIRCGNSGRFLFVRLEN